MSSSIFPGSALTVGSTVINGGTSGRVLYDNAGVLGETTISYADIVTGPASATDNAIARFDGATGKILQNSGVLIDDTKNITGALSLVASDFLQVGTNAVGTGSLYFSGLTSGNIRVKSADVAGTWTWTLPADDGAANGLLQTDGSGVTSWSNILAAASLALGGATIGSHALAVTGTAEVTGTIRARDATGTRSISVTNAAGSTEFLRIGHDGTNTLYSANAAAIFYSNSVEVLRYATTGVTATFLALATTSTDGVIIANTTAATGGATVQISPRTRWRGTAWDTAASQTVDMFAEVLPVSAATPSGIWRIGKSINGGATTYPLTLTSAGVLTTLGSIAAGSGATVFADNVSDLGGSTSFISGGVTTLFNGATNMQIKPTSGLQISPADSITRFGGTTSSFPALKRSTTKLMVRLADDSAYATLDALGFQVGGVAGANFSGVPLSITVVNGLVTAVA